MVIQKQNISFQLPHMASPLVEKHNYITFNNPNLDPIQSHKTYQSASGQNLCHSDSLFGRPAEVITLSHWPRGISRTLQRGMTLLLFMIIAGQNRHGKSGNLGITGSRKILHVAENLNKNIKQFLHKSIQTSKQISLQVNREY